MINPAVVTKVLPERHGVLVSFRNGVEFHENVGNDSDLRFVRVLERRAHNFGGATVCLPQVGELGLVLDVDPSLAVWIGSIPWEKANQMDPRPGIEAWRHASGVQLLVLDNGDTQFWHPTGVGFTVSRSGETIPEMAGSMPPERLQYADADQSPHVFMQHPSGFSLRVNPAGALTVSAPESVSIQSDKDVNLTAGGKLVASVTGDASLTVKGDATLKAAKIILDGPVECTSTLKVTADATIGTKSFLTHLHTCATPGSPTSPPV